jgi:hypothetical protein
VEIKDYRQGDLKTLLQPPVVGQIERCFQQPCRDNHTIVMPSRSRQASASLCSAGSFHAHRLRSSLHLGYVLAGYGEHLSGIDLAPLEKLHASARQQQPKPS